MREDIEIIVLKEENKRLQEAILSLDSEIKALKSFMKNELGVKIEEQLIKVGVNSADTPYLFEHNHRCIHRYVDIETRRYRYGIRMAKEVLNKIEEVCGR